MSLFLGQLQPELESSPAFQRGTFAVQSVLALLWLGWL
jgi:hypothetical protein